MFGWLKRCRCRERIVVEREYMGHRAEFCELVMDFDHYWEFKITEECTTCGRKFTFTEKEIA